MYKYDLKNNPELARERHNAQNREWYRKHREQKMEYQRKYRAAVRMYKQNGIWEFMKGFRETQIEGTMLICDETFPITPKIFKDLKRLKKELKQRGITL